MRTFRVLGASGAVAVIGFLALRSSPRVAELAWVPRWLSAWADHHGSLRNLPAFAALALVLILTLGRRPGSALAALLGVFLELAQTFISGRTFDWADIGWSLAGVVAVSAAFAVACFFRNRPGPAINPAGRERD